MEVGELGLAVLGPVFATALDEGNNLRPAIVQMLLVMRVKEPILHLPIASALDRKKRQPMRGNSEHQMQYHRFGALVFAELGDFAIEFIFAAVVQDEVLVLEGPGVGEEVEGGVFGEN